MCSRWFVRVIQAKELEIGDIPFIQAALQKVLR